MKRSYVVRLLFAVLAVFALGALVAGTFTPSAVAQDSAPLTLEITSVSVTLPTTTLTANVYTLSGVPVTGLTADNFALRGALADAGGRIVSVQNVAADDIDFSVLLVIDTSSSMYGPPLERTKQAAQTFIANLRPNDPVALVAFNSDVQLIQDYTLDRDLMSAAIDGLQSGGRTALYDAAADSLRYAAHSPTARRIIVFLSDGQEDRGSESATRFGSIGAARDAGILMYTIGFGSVDQVYMQRLADAAGAQFFLAPSVEQVGEIYSELSARLRTEYIITLDTPFPADGTEYPFELVVTVPEGSVSAEGGVRAPVPIPYVTLPDLPTEPITEPITLTADIRADDPLTGVTVQLGDGEPQPLEAPFSITIDPVLYPPGDLALTLNATDEDGETGTLQAALTIGALPSSITIEPDPASLGAISEPTDFTVEITGQTPPTAITYQVGDKDPITVDAGTAMFPVSIDPFGFAPGMHVFDLEVTNEGGVTTSVSADFEIAALPPVITITGLTEGAQISSTTAVLVEARGQVGVGITGVTARMANGLQVVELEPLAVDLLMFELDPLQFEPGAWNFVVSAALENGQTQEVTIPVIVSALPPEILIDGLTNGDTLTEDTEITITSNSQTPVTRVTVSIDGIEQAALTAEPFTYTIRVLDFAPGDHMMRIAAAASNGQSATLDVVFTIDPAPAATATFIAAATTTAVFEATSTAENVIAAGATQVAQASADAAIAAQAATSTQDALDAAATLEAVTATQAAMDSTERAASTATQAAVDATVTAEFAATQAILDATTTVEAGSTATQDAVNAAASSTAGAARAATETADRATSTVGTATAAREAAATDAQGTILARQATATAGSATEAYRTEIAAARTATADVILAGTGIARTATGEARATIDAAASAVAEESTATGEAIDAVAATARADARATETRISQASVVEEVTQRAETEAASSATALVVTLTPTPDVTDEVTAEPTEEPTEAPVTAVAQGAGTATATLTAVEIDQQQPAINPESLPLVFVGLGILLILIVVIYLILTSRRRDNRNR